MPENEWPGGDPAYSGYAPDPRYGWDEPDAEGVLNFTNA